MFLLDLFRMQKNSRESRTPGPGHATDLPLICHSPVRSRSTGLLVALMIGLFSTSPTPCWSQSPSFAAGLDYGQITDTAINEASGIVASSHNPGVLWVHNDGSGNQLFAVGSDGSLLATYQFDGNPDDLEDIAIGPGPIAGIHYLYVGDIGDNGLNRNKIRTYRIPEPAVYTYFARNPIVEKLKLAEEISLVYPDGSHNAEAIMLDPQNGDLFIATKDNGYCQIFKADRQAMYANLGDIPLSLVQEIPIDQVSGADISGDGSEILIRNESLALYWSRNPGESIPSALARPATIVPTIGPPLEPNGEGITFEPAGLGYFTISEGVNPSLYFFERSTPPPAESPSTLFPGGTLWSYLDDGSNPGFSWRSQAFDDQNWPVGLAQFGYGEQDEQTLLRFGSDPDRKTITTFFRKTFQVPDASRIASLDLAVLYDDGIAVYLNGAEVLRSNLAPGAPSFEQATASNSDFENIWTTRTLDSGSLQNGRNLIAVEVHRRSRTEGDLSFDARLTARMKPVPLRFTEISWATDGNLQIRVEGPDGRNIQVQTSSNLIDWIRLRNLTLQNNTATFRESAAAGSEPQFFRLIPAE
jgi:hypothetical protein